jgi:hypothetical protein
MRPITVLFFGGGQDSTALLYLYLYNKHFKDRFIGDTKFVIIMSDTGNEFPETYLHVDYISTLCKANEIPFFFIKPSMGYHGTTWQSLQYQMEKNNNIFSVGLPKSCTDNLKIKVCYNFLEDYIKLEYGFSGVRKKAYYQYFERFGKLRTIIGFAKGEESRRVCDSQLELFPEQVKDPRAVYIQKNIDHIYPLIEMKIDRDGCQDIIRQFGHTVPIPSNCMMCPFQNEAEIVYLERFYPKMWDYWVERESEKLHKNKDRPRNLAVKGSLTLPQFLENAKVKYKHWTDDELKHYRNSHGHCVKSKY